MSLLVALEVEVGVEALMAVGALESLDAAVDFQMLVQIGSLIKAEAAIREVADVGAFIRVDSQMVEEVVPLAEPLVASNVVALEDLDIALGSWVLVGEDAVLLGVGAMLFDVHLLQIEVFSGLDID